MCSRPNSHSPHTPHIHNTLHTHVHPHQSTHPHTFSLTLGSTNTHTHTECGLTHAHTHIHTHTHAQSPAFWPLYLLFLCQERLCLAPLTSSATWPPPGSPPCPDLASPIFRGRSACPMHFVIGDRSREGTAQVRIQHLPGHCSSQGAAGRVCRALPAPGVEGGLSEGVGVSPGPAS